MIKVTVTTICGEQTRILVGGESIVQQIVDYFDAHPLTGQAERTEISNEEVNALDDERTDEEIDRAMNILDLVCPLDSNN